MKFIVELSDEEVEAIFPKHSPKERIELARADVLEAVDSTSSFFAVKVTTAPEGGRIDELLVLLGAASHALKSYATGANSSTELAKEVSESCDSAIARAGRAA